MSNLNTNVISQQQTSVKTVLQQSNLPGGKKKQLFQDKTNNEPAFIIAKQIHPAGKSMSTSMMSGPTQQQ